MTENNEQPIDIDDDGDSVASSDSERVECEHCGDRYDRYDEELYLCCRGDPTGYDKDTWLCQDCAEGLIAENK